MKDGLVSRQDVMCRMTKYGFHAPDMTVHEFVEDELPSVPAVPLDKLCEWLGENSINIPCRFCSNFSNGYCIAIGETIKPCLNSAYDWRRAITKWMEGLE